MVGSKIFPARLTVDGRSFREILNLHSQWLDGSGGERANIRGGTLADAELQNVDLRKAILEGTVFLDANLSHVDFGGAILHQCDFRNANLSRADFTGAEMHRNNFQHCLLSDANFSEARMLDILFRDANMRDCRLYEVRLTSCDFTNANLNAAYFNRAVISECCFTEADMRKCNFLLARMNSCRFIAAKLNDAVFTSVQCVADSSRLRLIAHISGDLTEVLPYLNAEMPGATYCREAGTFTYMDGYRLVSLYSRRLTVAKADGLVDAWRTLESIRCAVNETWRRRGSIAPCWEMRQRPPALEIYRRLPGTNCRRCGEKTCLAFALRLWNGEVEPALCIPVFSGEHGELRAPLLEICSGLGVLGRVED